MPRGIATTHDLAMMAKVLDAYCDTYVIKDAVARETVGALIMELFEMGFREEDVLLAELIARRP